MPPVPRWDFGAACGPSRPPRSDVALRATDSDAGAIAAHAIDAPSAPLMIDGSPDLAEPDTAAPPSHGLTNDFPAASDVMPGSASDPPTLKGSKSTPAPVVPSSGFDSIEKRARGTPALSAATHARVSCARTQAAAVGLAIAIAVAAVAVAAYASSGWCPAAVRRYGVVAAAALVVDCVALQTVWVGAVALWRWMTAPAVHPGARSSVYHPPYPLHGAWAPS
jgi:hypothetical protein